MRDGAPPLVGGRTTPHQSTTRGGEETASRCPNLRFSGFRHLHHPSACTGGSWIHPFAAVIVGRQNATTVTTTKTNTYSNPTNTNMDVTLSVLITALGLPVRYYRTTPLRNKIVVRHDCPPEKSVLPLSHLKQQQACTVCH